jgi:hypothetical protein
MKKKRYRFTKEDARAGGRASVESRRCPKCGRVQTARELAGAHVCREARSA